MNLISKEQIIIISSTMARMKLTDDAQKTLIHSWTEGRTESRKELTYSEAELLKTHLNSSFKPADQKQDKMRKKIIAKFHQMGYSNNGRIDMERVNATILKYGYKHKQMKDYNWVELPKLVSQVSKMCDDYLINLRK